MLFLLASTALAQDPIDIGVLKNSDLKVVQRVLYTKEDKLEFGLTAGALPFDGFTFAPQLKAHGAMHFSDTLGIEVQAGGGYGLKTGRYNELAGPSYGVAVEAYRYLASLEADLQWTPIYAKLNLFGKRILHHDVYLLAGVGVTLEQSVLPSGDIAVAPGVPLGVGTRVWVGKNTAVRAELRDSLLYEHRAQSDTSAIKQNVSIGVGLAIFTGGN